MQLNQGLVVSVLCVCVSLSVCKYMHINIPTYLRTCVCVCVRGVCLCVCVCVCVYMQVDAREMFTILKANPVQPSAPPLPAKTQISYLENGSVVTQGNPVALPRTTHTHTHIHSRAHTHTGGRGDNAVDQVVAPGHIHTGNYYLHRKLLFTGRGECAAGLGGVGGARCGDSFP